MKGALIHISGNWAHFKKPETNNNPLTHDFITKTALIGMIGAVLGIDRDKMKDRFPELSEDLLYGVQINNAVKKESWSFTMRRATNLFDRAPKQMEFIRSPDYFVVFALRNIRSQLIFEKFISFIRNNKAKYTPILGLHNCHANLEFIKSGIFSEEYGDFQTKSFITKKCIIDMGKIMGNQIRLGFDRIPTYQDDDFWNWPDKYVDVIYPSQQQEITVKEHKYYKFNDFSKWILI